VYLSQVSTREAGKLKQFLPALSGQVCDLAIERFGLPHSSALVMVHEMFTFFDIQPDTPILPMQATPDELMKLINAMNQTHFTADQFIMVGMDVGNESIAFLTARPENKQWSGTVPVRYKNLSEHHLTPRLLAERQYYLPVSAHLSLWRSLNNALTILKAVDAPSTLQEIPA